MRVTVSLLIIANVASFILCIFFFFNDTATTEIYTLSLHDALPICRPRAARLPVSLGRPLGAGPGQCRFAARRLRDRKSTRLNSSHGYISYAVFCLKKKKKKTIVSTYNSTHKCQLLLTHGMC